MRGDCLAREGGNPRAIRASLKGLTVAEIVRGDGVKKAIQMRSPSKACSKKWDGLFCFGHRRQ